MKLNKIDYMFECIFDGGYYVWFIVNMQCNVYGDLFEEVVKNLEQIMEDLVEEMYLVEDFIQDKSLQYIRC